MSCLFNRKSIKGFKGTYKKHLVKDEQGRNWSIVYHNELPWLIEHVHLGHYTCALFDREWIKPVDVGYVVAVYTERSWVVNYDGWREEINSLPDF